VKKTDSFSQPIDDVGGKYPTQWAGYVHLQPRTPEGKSHLRHLGDDYNGAGGGNSDLGYDVKAIANGVVEKVIYWNGRYGFGNHVFVKHYLSDYLKEKCGNGIIYSHYAHLDAFRCHEGQEVTKGQVIAKLGNSGTRWAHLHLSIRKPTGRGYEDYPSHKSLSWINERYFRPYTFIQENLEPKTPELDRETRQPVCEDDGSIHPVSSPSDVPELPQQPRSDRDVSSNNDTPNIVVPSKETSPENTEKDKYSGLIGLIRIIIGEVTKLWKL